jgi:hypothetical protein
MGATTPKQYLNANEIKGLGEASSWGHSGGTLGAAGGRRIQTAKRSGKMSLL